MNDADLLQAYARDRSEEAFRMLIDRYVGLVYSACWRQLRDRHLAEDATQGVFILLSQKAGKLRQERVAGWLLAAARYACAGIRRTQLRRQRREKAVAMEKRPVPESGGEEMLGMLDEGLNRLGAADREALVRRYLQDQPLKEVGAALGVSEDAARKRVDRGLDKLKRFFLRRGVEANSVALAALLAEQASGAVAGGLTAAMREGITQGVLQACHAGAGSAAAGVLIAKGAKVMMLTAQLKVAAAVAVVTMAGAGGSWWAVGQVVSNKAVTVAAAPAVAVDLTTPEKSLESFARALKAGDRASVYACLADGDQLPRPVAGYFVIQMAHNRMMEAARRTLGATGEQARAFFTLDQGVEMMLADAQARGQKAKIDGMKAALLVDFSAAAIKQVPDEGARPDLQLWAGRAVYFQRVGEAWKLDTLRTLRVVVTLWGKDNRAVDGTNTRMEAMLDYAKAFDELTADLAGGKVRALAGLETARQARIKTMLDDYESLWLEVRAMPADDDEVVLRLSDPVSAVASLCRAMRAGDRAKTYACLAVDPNRPPLPVDGLVSWCLAANRLKQAAGTAYGMGMDQGWPWVTMDTLAEFMWCQTGGLKTTVHAEVTYAVIVAEVPAEKLASVPPDMQEPLKDWSGKPLRLKIQGGQCRIDLDNAVRVNAIMTDGKPGDAPTTLAILTDLAAALDATAAEIKSGKLKTLQAAKAADYARLAQVTEKHGGYRTLHIQGLEEDQWKP